MSKLFVQLVLSVILGVGAAVGFSPRVRTDVHGTLSQANASLHETVSAAVTNTNKGNTNASTIVLVKTNTGVFSKDSVKADLNLKSDLKAKKNAGDASPVKLLPDLSVKNSLTNGTQTKLEADGSSLAVRGKDETKSTLNLDLGSGK